MLGDQFFAVHGSDAALQYRERLLRELPAKQRLHEPRGSHVQRLDPHLRPLLERRRLHGTRRHSRLSTERHLRTVFIDEHIAVHGHDSGLHYRDGLVRRLPAKQRLHERGDADLQYDESHLCRLLQ